MIVAFLVWTIPVKSQETSDPLEFAVREQTTGPLLVGMYGSNFVGAKLGWIWEAKGKITLVGGFTGDVMYIEPDAESLVGPHRSRGIDGGASVYVFIPLGGRWLLTVGDGLSFRAYTFPDQENTVETEGLAFHLFAGVEYRVTRWLHVGIDGVIYMPLYGANVEGFTPDGYRWSYGVMPHLAFRFW